MKRWSILIFALLVGAAAPARAWCEATCLAPSPHDESRAPHCPSHEQPSDAPTMSAASDADCPVIESARPVPVKVEVLLMGQAATPHPAGRAASASHPCILAPAHPRTPALQAQCAPLRI